MLARAPAPSFDSPRRSPSGRFAQVGLADADTLVAQTLRRRRAWRQLIGVESVLLALLFSLAIAGMGAVLLVALTGGGGMGPWIAGLAGVLGLGLAGWHLGERLNTSRDLPRWAAEQVVVYADRAGAAEALRSALEIAHRARGPQPEVPLGSPLLIARTIAAGAEGLGALDTARKLLRSRLWQYGGLLVMSGAAWAWSTVAAPAVWRQLLDADGPTGPVARDVGTVVGDAHLRIEPPAYARAALGVRHEDTGDATVLRGSQVTATAEPLPAFRVLQVEVEAATPTGPRLELLAVSPARAEKVQWTRTIMEPMRYRYRGQDPEGKPVREQTWRELRTLADAPPQVSISAPLGEIEVRSGQSVAIAGEVVDDIGLSLVNLVVSRPASGVERRPVAVGKAAVVPAGTPAPEPRVEVLETIAVDALQLRPGEVALVHIEAADNNPLDDTRRSASAKVRIRMFSAERHHARSLDDLAQLTQAWTLRLADRLERDPAQQQAPARKEPHGPNDPQKQERAQPAQPGLAHALRNRTELAEAEQRAIDALRTLQQQLADDTLSRKKTVADLAETERRLQERLGDETRAVHRMDPQQTGYAAVRDLYTLQRHHAEVIEAEEEAVHALAALASAEHQGALARDGKSLAEAEKQLVATLEKLAEADSAPLQAEAERLLDAVEQQLDRMAAAAQKQLHLVPHEHVNEGGLDATGLQRDLGDHRQALAEVRQLLRAGNTREALDKMRRLQEAMKQVTGGVQQGVDRARTAEEAALERLVADLHRGIARAQQGQGRLRDSLRPSAEEQDRAAGDHLRLARSALIPQVIQLLHEARDQVRPQRLTTPALHGQRGLAGARAALGTAVTALEQAQIDGALQALLEAEDLLAAARRSLRPADATEVPKTSVPDANRLAIAADKTARAAARLREALPPPMALLRPPTRQRVEGDAMAQEQVRRALEKVRQRLAEGAEAHPALQRQVGDRLDHALQTMRETAEALQRYDASRGFEQTAETLDALERALGLLDDQGQGQPAQPPSGERIGHGPAERSVDVQSGNQGDSADRFREDVLRAMQQRLPASYQERLQRYYKAISR